MTIAENHRVEEQFREAREQVLRARTSAIKLCISGGNTKSFLSPVARDIDRPIETLSLPSNVGIVSYQPSELVITVRAGTKLADVIAALADKKQMLGFEPPSFGAAATIGGTVASALNGPARPYLGSLRDAILGIKVMTGTGEVARFGGEVMKNVAGYDVSRLFVGSMGSLGVLLEVSLRVQPIPKARSYRYLVIDEGQALAEMGRLRKMSLPISAMAHIENKLRLRLSGSEIAIQQAESELANFDQDDPEFWHLLNEQQLEFFNSSLPLWRLTLPFEAALPIAGERLWDWGGGLCWIKTGASAEEVCALAKELGGAASLFRGVSVSLGRGGNKQIAQMRKKLKAAFDPDHVFLSRSIWHAIS